MNIIEKANETRPRTVEELAALPITGFGMETHTLTESDKANGYIMIGDRRVYTKASAINIPVEQQGFIAHMMGDGPEWYTDENGDRWHLALHESGKWFRRMS
jgi:hypothetical protein